MNQNIYGLIEREYDRRQRQVRDKLASKKNEIINKIPEFDEIEGKIKHYGIKYSKLVLTGRKSSDSEVSALLIDMENLRKKKKALLKFHNYPSDYLEPEYKCRACRDTGFINNSGIAVQCSCYRQQIINHLYDKSNLELTKFENFDTFNIQYYPDKVDEKKYGTTISPKENILNIKERCLTFIENFDSPDEKNLFFSGPPGVGKTFMASCIANELLAKGRTVLYQTSPVLFSTINDYKYRFSKNEEFWETGYRNIFEVELLIIDDLGIEPTSPARYAELLTILNTRQINNLNRPCKTMIATNIGPKQLFDFYTERVVSRIVGHFDRLMFVGDDIRMLKK